jgi:hypothetical protein
MALDLQQLVLGTADSEGTNRVIKTVARGARGFRNPEFALWLASAPCDARKSVRGPA